jgi:glutamyl-tRNA synthetase
VGGARTALFNWLYARKHGGAFVVRIEDTDVERSSPESERGVLDDLRWLGLDWDEGPDVGGPFGPYRQSERLVLYRTAADRLLASGAAFACFCTDEELAARRQAALAAGRPPHYDGRCRDLTEAERAARRTEGRPESVRFRVPKGDQVLRDEVRGEVRFPEGMVGDFVLLRSNGLPTYNFACVVDDSGMKFTHVIRAEEHLSNTPRQLMLYQALGEKPPAFAHVPLILNRDRTKMSKREGEAAVAVGDWRRAGFVADALIAYLALLGFHPGDDREILTRAELLEAFTLDRVGSAGSVFDPDKLRWVNAHVLHHAGGETLRQWGESFLPEVARALPEDRLTSLLELVRGNLATLADLPQELQPFLTPGAADEPEASQALSQPQAPEVLAAVAAELEALAEWNAERVKSAIQSAGKRLGARGPQLYHPVRAALTGRTHGPELVQIAAWLGQAETVNRLRARAARATSAREMP